MRQHHLSLLAAAACFTASPGMAHEVISLHGPHEHGAAELAVVRDGASLQLTLVVSASDLVGFERAPETPRERKALRDAYRTLKHPETFMTTACKLESAELDAELLAREEHSANVLEQILGGATEEPRVVGKDGHTDFQAVYHYRCDGEARFGVTLFAAFPSVRQIRVRERTPQGAVKQMLMPQSSELLF